MRRALLIAAFLLLAGCLEGDEGDAPPPGGGASPTGSATPSSPPTPAVTVSPGGEPGPVALETLASGQMAGTREEARRVFTDEASFAAFWAEVREEEEPAPEVDFTQSTVVAAVSAARPNACSALRVTNATASAGGEVDVEVTTYTGSPDMICAQVVTYPWHIVALEGEGRQVRFTERVEQGLPADEE